MNAEYNDQIATMGDRMAAAREMANLTQEQVATRLGVKKSTIRKWENNQSEPRSNRLYMLAGLLECHVMWLMTGEGDSPTQNYALDDPARRLVATEINDIRHDMERLLLRLEALENGLKTRNDD